MAVHSPTVPEFRMMILDWWKTNKRDLPWRRTRDPYRILISEIMLQQTQVSRVLPKYGEFLRLYPDVVALSRASVAGLLRVWKGMGYNRRALYLKRLAETIVSTYGNKFPEDEKLLTKLPGLGTYTARALLVFAFEKDVAMVDTNIRQIITHYFFNGLPQKDKIIQETADALVPRGKSWQWHQALMDYGALALPRTKPKAVRKGVAFKDSTRFFRGKIIDALREKSWHERKLVRTLAEKYGRDSAFLHRIADGLIKDGLAARSHGKIQLPA